MKKLIKGIVEFRKNVRAGYRETFAKLALGQSPDTLFIACSDSRVVPNLFASADPGDLFVVRNVGNLIAPAGENDRSLGDEAEAAAIEFACVNLGVSDVIVCGHSECGAMKAILGGRENVPLDHLKSWLQNGDDALARLTKQGPLDASLSKHNQLSQLNVLMQLDHLKTYVAIREGIAAGKLRLHAWWFDIANADVYAYEEDDNRFILIDEKESDRLLSRLT